ncbi:hypothetical protein NDU88_003848 [Pleurodeles waltl]|uniref:Uncharacterized protein n=1 Tax=Pleurodeles waltl TaxID=8319 RepID=A0AAV7SH33_PLEWA|nr:hypothetical protein NDU88_003848 [Pleurodeles waltl]
MCSPWWDTAGSQSQARLQSGMKKTRDLKDESQSCAPLPRDGRGLRQDTRNPSQGGEPHNSGTTGAGEASRGMRKMPCTKEKKTAPRKLDSALPGDALL